MANKYIGENESFYVYLPSDGGNPDIFPNNKNTNFTIALNEALVLNKEEWVVGLQEIFLPVTMYNILPEMTKFQIGNLYGHKYIQIPPGLYTPEHFASAVRQQIAENGMLKKWEDGGRIETGEVPATPVEEDQNQGRTTTFVEDADGSLKRRAPVLTTEDTQIPPVRRKGEEEEGIGENTEYLCRECGLRLANDESVSKHTDATGHASFVPVLPAKTEGDFGTIDAKIKAETDSGSDPPSSPPPPAAPIPQEEYVCGHCGDRFTNLTLLNLHTEIALGHSQPRTRRYCRICNIQYPGHMMFRSHMQHVHKSVYCSYCDILFLSRDLLRAHMRFVHGQRDKLESTALMAAQYPMSRDENARRSEAKSAIIATTGELPVMTREIEIITTTTIRPVAADGSAGEEGIPPPKEEKIIHSHVDASALSKRFEGKIIYHANAKKFYFHLNTGEFFKVMNRDLRAMMGFGQEDHDNNGVLTHGITNEGKVLGLGGKRGLIGLTYPAEFDLFTRLIYVYTNIIGMSSVGSITSPILRIMSNNITLGKIQESIIHNVYDPPQYFPLSSNRTREINIQLRDFLGREISLQSGKIVVVLHFKRAKKIMTRKE